MASASGAVLVDSSRDLLVQRANIGNLPDLILLPTKLIDGDLLYSEYDVDSLKLARAAGLNVEYLLPKESRRFVGEFSQGFAINMAIGVAQNIGADALIGLGFYLLTRIRNAIDQGLASDDEPPNLDIQVARIDTTNGGVIIEGLSITARGEESVESLFRAISSAATAEAALRALSAQRDVDDDDDDTDG